MTAESKTQAPRGRCASRRGHVSFKKGREKETQTCWLRYHTGPQRSLPTAEAALLGLRCVSVRAGACRCVRVRGCAWPCAAVRGRVWRGAAWEHHSTGPSRRVRRNPGGYTLLLGGPGGGGRRPTWWVSPARPQ